MPVYKGWPAVYLRPPQKRMWNDEHMRNTELQARAAVAAAVLALLVGCGGSGESGGGRGGGSGGFDDVADAYVFQIAAPTNALEPGQSVQLRTVVQDVDLRDLNVRLAYSSSNPEVATVSANGRVTALQPGTTQISVESPGGSNSARTSLRLFVQHPVRNKIAFVSIRGPNVGSPPSPAGGIYLMNPDGSDQQLLAPSVVEKCSFAPSNSDTCPKHWTQPSWNRDGMRLATSSSRFIEAERSGTLIFLCSTAHPECDRLDVYPPVQHPVAPFPLKFPLIAFEPSWSPQGDRLALSRGLWNPSEHLLSEWSRREPDWSPDGARIVHVVDGLFITTLADSGLVRLTGPDTRDENPAWSPDGAHIAFATDRDGNFEIYLLRLSDGALTNLTNAAGDDRFPTWSPDSTRIAFQTNRDGNDEIYSMQADGSSPMNLSNNPAPDREPAWSRN
jgi:Bacterial Ig-like domain (group 2)/WD40-like Beta Propeller Repeat